MTVSEPKRTVDAMTPEERIFVAAYLQHLARANDPAHQAKLGARMNRMEAGRKVSLEQAERLHQALEADGASQFLAHQRIGLKGRG